MATGFKIPKGVKLDKETTALLSSASFIARAKKREATIANSKLDSGYWPEGDLCYKITRLRVSQGESKDKQKDKQTTWVDYVLSFKVVDHTRDDNNENFTKRFRIFDENPEKQRKSQSSNKEDFSYDAGEMKLIVASAHEETPTEKQLNSEQFWIQTILQAIAAELVFRGRAWTTEVTKDDGKKFFNKSIRTFGLLNDEHDPDAEVEDEEDEEEEEVDTDEEEVEDEEEEEEEAPKKKRGRPRKVKDEEEDEEEEEEESDEDEEEESDEESDDEVEEEEDEEEEEEGDDAEVEIDVGTVVEVEHKKHGVVEATVKELDEDEGTFVGAFEANGKKMKATFQLSDIQNVTE